MFLSGMTSNRKASARASCCYIGRDSLQRVKDKPLQRTTPVTFMRVARREAMPPREGCAGLSMRKASFHLAMRSEN